MIPDTKAADDQFIKAATEAFETHLREYHPRLRDKKKIDILRLSFWAGAVFVSAETVARCNEQYSNSAQADMTRMSDLYRGVLNTPENDAYLGGVGLTRFDIFK